MEYKIAYHADKMKLVCILEAILFVFNIIQLVIQSKLYYTEISAFNVVLSLVPLLSLVFIFEYEKIWRGSIDQTTLFRIYTWVEIAIIIGINIFNAYDVWCNNSSYEHESFFFVLWRYSSGTLIYLIPWILIAVFWKRKVLFTCSRIAALVYPLLRIFENFIVFIRIISGDFSFGFVDEELELFALQYFLYIIQGCLSLACTILLLFFVFKRATLTVEERLQRLNKKYTSGKISREEYEAKCRNILGVL